MDCPDALSEHGVLGATGLAREYNLGLFVLSSLMIAQRKVKEWFIIFGMIRLHFFRMEIP
jgi:hypothetical protein